MTTATATQGGFVEAPKVYLPIEAAEYGVELLEFEDVKTRSGRAIKATFKVNTGEHDGRRLWHYFNYKNASEFAEKIGKEQLDKVIIATGGEGLEAFEGNMALLNDFVGLPLIAKVATTEATPYTDKNGTPQMGKAGNKITSFKAR